MKIYRSLSLLFGLSLSILLTNCTDPIDIGAELLSEDRARVGFTDTLSIRATTVIGDTFLSYYPTAGLEFYFGREVNPVFGTTEASLYLEPRLHILPNGDLLPVPDGMASGTVDSIYLVLPLDSSGVYGDIYANMFGVEVLELAEPLVGDEDGRFYSNATFATTGTILGSKIFSPSFDTTLVGTLIDFEKEDTFKISAPHLRIPLDLSLGQRLLALGDDVYRPETQSVGDSLFVDAFKGMLLRPTMDTKGLLNFDLGRFWTGIYLYYTVDGVPYTYKYDFSSRERRGDRVSKIQHQYTGALAESFINSQVGQDSLVFIQGLQGLFMKLEFPDLQNFTGKIVNQAILEMTVAQPMDYDYAIFPPAPQLVAMTQDSEGAFRLITEIGGFGDPRTFFSGAPVEQEDGSWQYSANISIHLQYMLDQREPATLYLAINNQGSDSPRSADRVILQGPASRQAPMRLKLSFTED
ncbi:MAG: DUF4270 family protein [Bacteroidetes bacterium]|nr:MAG: DUF4270 family protein [Bacteroidota bacterium]